MTGPSLRVRLTLWYTFALVVIIALLAADVLWVLGRIGMRRVDRELDDLIGTAAHVLTSELQEGNTVQSAAREATTTLAARGRALLVLDARGGALAESGGPLRLPSAGAPAPPATWTDRDGLIPRRVRVQRVKAGPTVVTVLAATAIQDMTRERREVEEAMVVGIPIALLLATGGGLWIAAIGLRPVTAMAARATQLAPNGLEDLGQTDRRDELGQLATAFNGLVARLRAALQTQRQFMADASHELRTPVSVIRTAAEVSLAREGRPEADYRQTLVIVRDEARRVGHLVGDMLMLARADAGGYRPRVSPLYFDEVLAECERAVSVLAADRHVVVASTPTPEFSVSGDEELLRQLVLNILQNAVQHTPAGGVVRVDACAVAGQVEVRVTDAGPGIAPADWERIFDRFVQIDPARRRAGSGLGLPIARWAAAVHHGTVHVERSDASGTTFLITLPLQPRS